MNKNKLFHIIDNTLYIKELDRMISLENKQLFKYSKLQDIDKSVVEIQNLLKNNNMNISIVGEEVDVLINYTYSNVDRLVLKSFLERLEFNKVNFYYEEENIPEEYKIILSYNKNFTTIIDKASNQTYIIDFKLLVDEDELLNIVTKYIQKHSEVDKIYVHGENQNIKYFTQGLENKLKINVYYSVN